MAQLGDIHVKIVVDDTELKKLAAVQAPTSESLRKVDPRPTYEELVAAMRSALEELGVPDDSYPANITNAWQILNEQVERVDA